MTEYLSVYKYKRYINDNMHVHTDNTMDFKPTYSFYVTLLLRCEAG
jgi:hypothetical protein